MAHVDPNVDRPEFLLDTCSSGFHLIGISDVGDDRKGTTAEGLDLRGRPSKTILTPREQRHRFALGKRLCRCAPDSSRGTGDHDHSAHCDLPRLGRATASSFTSQYESKTCKLRGSVLSELVRSTISYRPQGTMICKWCRGRLADTQMMNGRSLSGSTSGSPSSARRLREFLRHNERACAQWDLTPQRFLLLLVIKGAPDGSERMSFTDLAGRLHLSRNTVTELCARAEESGLLSREPSEVDQRVVYLRLTHEGERRLEAVGEEMHGYRSELRASFDQLSESVSAGNAATEEGVGESVALRARRIGECRGSVLVVRSTNIRSASCRRFVAHAFLAPCGRRSGAASSLPGAHQTARRRHRSDGGSRVGLVASGSSVAWCRASAVRGGGLHRLAGHLDWVAAAAKRSKWCSASLWGSF